MFLNFAGTKILPSLPAASRPLVTQATVFCRLDYCNSLYLGSPAHVLQRLQRVQSAAAKTALGLPSCASTSGALAKLCWLPILQRVHFKSLCTVYKAINTGPSYLQSTFVRYAPVRSLRSSTANLLKIPEFRKCRTGGRSFSVQAANLWNTLPLAIKNAPTLLYFQKLLKPYLFPN